MSRILAPLPCVLFAWLMNAALAGPLSANSSVLATDPHYTELGFFDIHLCNWPERPEYFKVLFSTEHFEDVVSMDVYMPDGTALVSLDKDRFIPLRREGRPERRVFMLDIDVPPSASVGWYRIRVRTRSGSTAEGRDFVTLSRLERVSMPDPPRDAEDITMPEALSWAPVPGARYYQAYLRDAWTDQRIFSTALLDEPRAELPGDLLEPGGYYYWTVHARDTNEHILLGDFSMGSMSERFYFSVAR
ncbi:hypothetical protein [Thioalkalivibrio thiocyanodenitrificans]|uniref:hypothetical protein n=1 Tax=Thioalkalivibrio thiocyanodenitrificans TaxID=243063 RepID=UPI00039F686E|nr:hypothetical protein [Thioalkalivibrio thiocyanodenitrificans]